MVTGVGQNGKGVLADCDRIFQDLGCEDGVPFGAVTLESIINKAEKLVPPTVRTLFVFTDDEHWFNEKRKAMKSSTQSG